MQFPQDCSQDMVSEKEMAGQREREQLFKSCNGRKAQCMLLIWIQVDSTIATKDILRNTTGNWNVDWLLDDIKKLQILLGDHAFGP